MKALLNENAVNLVIRFFEKRNDRFMDRIETFPQGVACQRREMLRVDEPIAGSAFQANNRRIRNAWINAQDSEAFHSVQSPL